MKKLISNGLVFTISLLAPQITQAQGTITYLSNLNQTSVGSLAVGNDSWLAAAFGTGNHEGGYLLNSVQLEMANASGNPNSFNVMLYTEGFLAGPVPGNNLGSLSGSADPSVAGIYTYTPASSLTLSPDTFYFIVLSAGTAITNGSYRWSDTGVASYNPSGGWSAFGGVETSSDGSHWSGSSLLGPQFAINAAPIPEPSSVLLFLIGGGVLAFSSRRSNP